MTVISAPSAPTHELPGARFTALAVPSSGTSETSVWRVEIQPGTPSVPHSLTREEIMVVTSGRASVRIGDQVSEAGVGDAIVVPPGAHFELNCAGEEPVRALCLLPVGGAGAGGRRRALYSAMGPVRSTL
ncbi:MAG: cupin domain-containing protein [Nocardioides sp.]